MQPETSYLVSGDVHLNKEEMEEQMSLSHSGFIVEFPGAEDGRMYHLFMSLDTVSPATDSDGNTKKPGQAGANYYFHLTGNDDNADRDDFWTYSATAEELLGFLKRQCRDLPPKWRGVLDKATVERMKCPPVRLNTLIMDSLPVSRVTLLGDAARK